MYEASTRSGGNVVGAGTMTENRFALFSSSSTGFALCLLAYLACALSSSWWSSDSPNDLFGLHIELSSTIGPQMAAHMTGTASGGSASPAAIAKRTNKMALMAQPFASSTPDSPIARCQRSWGLCKIVEVVHVMESRRRGRMPLGWRLTNILRKYGIRPFQGFSLDDVVW